MENEAEYKGLIKQKLAKKLLSVLAFSLLIVGILTIILNYYLSYEILETQTERRAQSISQGLEFATEGLLEMQENNMLSRVVQNYATLKGIVGIVILDPNSKIIAYAPDKLTNKVNLLNNPELSKAIAQSTQTGIEADIRITLEDEDILVYLLPFSSVLFSGNPRRGVAIVMLSLEYMQQQASQIVWNSIISLSLGLIAILLITNFWLDKLVIYPINIIYQAIKYHRYNGNFLEGINLPPNEIKFLAWGFQKQFEELKTSHENLKQEVKERKRKEEELRHSQEIFDLVLDNIPQNVFWKDCNSVFLGCNKTFLKITNATTIDEIVGKTDKEMPWGEYSEWYRQCERWIMDNDTPKDHIIERVINAEGKTLWIDTNKVPLHDGEGKVMGILGTFEDITVRKRLEDEKENALIREREISAHKSRFINIVSHEFRNPLTVILASAQLLENYWSRLTHEKKQSHLHNIQIAGNRLKDMINDLLIISKAEYGQISMTCENLNFNKFCLEILEEFKLGTGKNHIFNFHTKGLNPTSVEVRLDDKIMRYIISNLLSNAIKYSSQGSHIDFQVEYQQEEIDLKISDQGIGISFEEQTLIFDSFYRGQNVSDISGTGLGLHIVKKCVDLYGGEISVTSQVNCGSSFHIKIPLKETGSI